MTMPHLMNCPHADYGWCLDCVQNLWEECFAVKKERDEMRAVLNELADEYVADYTRWIASFKNDPEALLRAMRRTGKSYRPRLPEWVFQYASKENVADYP